MLQAISLLLIISSTLSLQESPAGNTKTSASPTTLKKGSSAYFFAFDEDFVYWVEQQRGVVKVSRSGGEEIVVGGEFSSPRAIAVDKTQVYVGGGNGLWSISKEGGEATLLVSGNHSPYQILTDKTRLYWTDYGSGAVMSVDKDGGDPSIVAADVPGAYGIAMEGDFLYWANFNYGTIKKVSKKGGAVTTLATKQQQPCGIAVVGGQVYWANFQGQSIMRLAPGGSPELIIEDESQIAFLVLDAKNIYWATYSGAGASTGVFRATREGAGIKKLAAQKDCLFIAGDDLALFWMSFDSYPDNGALNMLRTSQPK